MKYLLIDQQRIALNGIFFVRNAGLVASRKIFFVKGV